MFKVNAWIKVLVLCLLIPTALMIDTAPHDQLVALMLIEPPGQLIYEVDHTGGLNQAGGELRRLQDFRQNEFYESSLALFGPDYLTFHGRYFHPKVNFKKKGVYLILFARKGLFTRTVYFQYTVQVVPSGLYEFDVPEGAEEIDVWTEAAEDYCENVTAIMTSPPDNIVYPVGYEGEIDPAGIVVRAASGWFPRRYAIEKLDYTLESDVDFNTPGSYIVRVDYTDPKGGEHWFIFTVAVAKSLNAG